MNKNNIIHLLISSVSDQTLLRHFLEDRGYYVKVSTTLTKNEFSKCSVVIIDEISAHRYGHLLLELKRDASPLFIPIAVLLP